MAKIFGEIKTTNPKAPLWVEVQNTLDFVNVNTLTNNVLISTHIKECSMQKVWGKFDISLKLEGERGGLVISFDSVDEFATLILDPAIKYLQEKDHK